MILAERIRRGLRTPAAGYAAAGAVPIAITFGVARLNMPPFVFEHLIVLLVVAVAIPWGLSPAVLTSIVSVLADDVLLRDDAERRARSAAVELSTPFTHDDHTTAL